MNQPQSFHGTPGLSSLHPAPTPVAGEPVGGWGPSMRAVATLTVYADGNVNLNGEAGQLLDNGAGGVCLVEPAKVRAGRRPAPWLVTAGGCCSFRGRSDKPGQLRFWADRSACPAPGRYLLAATAQVGHYALVPM